MKAPKCCIPFHFRIQIRCLGLRIFQSPVGHQKRSNRLKDPFMSSFGFGFGTERERASAQTRNCIIVIIHPATSLEIEQNECKKYHSRIGVDGKEW
jgi:hypothetical protein